MKKIKIVNPTKRIEKLTEALAEGDRKTVNYEFQLIKNELLRQKRSAQYYEKNYNDVRSNVAKAQIKTLNANLDLINQYQKMANEYVRNPAKIRLNKSIANLNLIDQKFTAIRKETQKSKTTIVNIKAEQKTEKLFTNLFMNNDVYNSAEIIRLGKEVEKILPTFDIMIAIKGAFAKDYHYNSGDEQEELMNSILVGEGALQNQIAEATLNDEDYNTLKSLYERIYSEIESGVNR